MRIAKVRIKRFRSLVDTGWIDFHPITMLAGRNDVGKSNVLLALDRFFNEKVETGDLHYDYRGVDNFEISISFSANNLADKELIIDATKTEKTITTLGEEKLLDESDFLTITKVLTEKSRQPVVDVKITIHDFSGDFQFLPSREEGELIEIGRKNGLELPRSGAGKLNKDKRCKLRDRAKESGTRLEETTLSLLKVSNDQLWPAIQDILATFLLYRSGGSLDIQSTEHRRTFMLPIVKDAISEVINKKERAEKESSIMSNVTTKITDFQMLFNNRTKMNLQFQAVVIKRQWEKLVEYDLEVSELGSEKQVLLRNRGAGTQRLAVMILFEWLLTREIKGDYIFSIEEPETFLHPGLQKQFTESIEELGKSGQQVIFTSHSPNFIGYLDLGGLIHVQLKNGKTVFTQGKDFKRRELEIFVSDMGVLPNDDLVGKYKIAVFIEGGSDRFFFEHFLHQYSKTIPEIADTLKDIIFIPVGGGDNLKILVNSNAVVRLGRKFCIIRDKDNLKNTDQAKLKLEVENRGGKLFILNKPEIEHYLSPNKIVEVSGKAFHPDPQKDLKKELACHFNINYRDKEWFSQCFKPIVEKMTIADLESVDHGEIKKLLSNVIKL